ncbi:MAG: trigger factor [Oscillospiraceae bacterium]|nr:trigger factor [Oscillospiraceae bacterium]
MEVKNLEKRENSAVAVTVTISPEEFDKALTAAYKKTKNSIYIPGFRKGKAPRTIIEKMYGEGVFYDDAINELAPEAYMYAVKEKELKVVAAPSLENANVTDDKALELTIIAVVYPEVTLGQYKGLEAVRKEVKVEDYEIEAEINTLRDRNSSIETVDREAKFGDTVVIDYEGFNEGVAFDGGKGEGYSLEIGSNTFIPGFEVQLIGAKAGDDIDVNVTFPTEYHSEELAGKPALFKVKVHEVKEKILPELDDEFAKDVSEFDTLEEYKKSIYDKLLEKKTNDSRDAFLDLLLAQIEENMQADINEGMIDERVDRVVEDYAQRLASQGMPFEQYLQMFGMTLEQFKAQSRPGAEKQIKSELALTKIAELENITVTEEDKDKEYQKMADMYHVELESVKEFFDVEILTDSILMTKAADFVIENAVALPEPKEEEKAEEAEAPAEEKKPAKKTTRKSTKKVAEPKEEEAAPAEATEE